MTLTGEYICLNGWKKIIEKSESGEKPIHRNREFEKDKRSREKEMVKRF